MTNVYTFGPTFRAENSNTPRHLAEFWMVEPEIAFADLDDLADLAEDFLKYIFTTVLEECPDDMAFFEKRIEPAAVSRLRDNKPRPHKPLAVMFPIRGEDGLDAVRDCLQPDERA